MDTTTYTLQVVTTRTIQVDAEDLAAAVSNAAAGEVEAGRAVAVTHINGWPVSLRRYDITGLRSSSDLLVLSVDHAGELVEGESVVSTYDGCFESGEATVYGDHAFATSTAAAVWAVHRDMVDNERPGVPDEDEDADRDALDDEWLSPDRIRTALLTAPAVIAASAAALLAGTSDEHLVAACALLNDQLEAFAAGFEALAPDEAPRARWLQYKSIAAQAAVIARHKTTWPWAAGDTAG